MKKLSNIVFIFPVIIINFSCSPYCKIESFNLNVEDILNSEKISMNNVTVKTNDSVADRLVLSKNTSYSPDHKFYVTYQFIPSFSNSSIGRCKANIFNERGELLLSVKNVLPHEEIVWFNNYIILDGFGNTSPKKNIVDLDAKKITKYRSNGMPELIGKNIDAAFYKTLEDKSSLGRIHPKSKYSVIKVSRHNVTLSYKANQSYFPFFYTDYSSIFYNSTTDSFTVRIKNDSVYEFQTSFNKIPFDQYRLDSSLYILQDNYKVFELDDEFNLFTEIRQDFRYMDHIKEFHVLGNIILFKAAHKVADKDFPDSGDYVTRNNLVFNIHDTIFDISTKFSFYVTEFGIYDIRKHIIYYPQISFE